MTGGRIALVVTGVGVAALAVVMILLSWDSANKIATVTSALAAVAAVGVAIWAAWPVVIGTGVRISRTGSAKTGPGGVANTGYRGNSLPESLKVDRTGDAEGGDANTGIQSN